MKIDETIEKWGERHFGNRNAFRFFFLLACGLIVFFSIYLFIFPSLASAYCCSEEGRVCTPRTPCCGGLVCDSNPINGIGICKWLFRPPSGGGGYGTAEPPCIISIPPITEEKEELVCVSQTKHLSDVLYQSFLEANLNKLSFFFTIFFFTNIILILNTYRLYKNKKEKRKSGKRKK